ncbi:hypothetical protein Tco_0037764 [Tanacetum coccineum]
MANLEFYDKHNMVAYLVKSEGSEGFHEIIDFLTSSHIYYALTECSTLYISLIEQFWQTAALSTTEDGVHAITATIDGRDKIITEVFIRRHLKLQDSDGLTSLPNAEILEQLARMGFIQILLNKQQRLLLPHTRTYSTPTLTNKLFNNMRRASKGYSGVLTPLFDTMLVQPQGEAPSTSPSRIISSPSLSSHHTTSSTPITPPSIQITHEADETATMPYDSPLSGGHTPKSDEGRLKHAELMELVTKLLDRVVAMEEDLKQTKKTYSTALTKLVLKVKKLEKQVREEGCWVPMAKEVGVEMVEVASNVEGEEENFHLTQSSREGEDVEKNKSSIGIQVNTTGKIVVERLLEKLVELPMCSLMVERMVDREEKKFLD